MFSDFFYLGKVTKHFGLQGEVVVLLDTDEPEKYYSMELVYLDIEGEPIPFFIENIKVKQYNKLGGQMGKNKFKSHAAHRQFNTEQKYMSSQKTRSKREDILGNVCHMCNRSSM